MTPEDWPAVERIYAEGIATRERDVRDVAARELRRVRRRATTRTSARRRRRRARARLGRALPDVARAPATPASPSTPSTSRRDARGRGVGRALMEKLAASAGAAGIWTHPVERLPGERRNPGAPREARVPRRRPASSASRSSTASGATRFCWSDARRSRYAQPSSQRRSTTHALCPPKPNELLTPTSMCCRRASFGM